MPAVDAETKACGVCTLAGGEKLYLTTVAILDAFRASEMAEA
jgi:hypothetical protein